MIPPNKFCVGPILHYLLPPHPSLYPQTDPPRPLPHPRSRSKETTTLVSSLSSSPTIDPPSLMSSSPTHPAILSRHRQLPLGDSLSSPAAPLIRLCYDATMMPRPDTIHRLSSPPRPAALSLPQLTARRQPSPQG